MGNKSSSYELKSNLFEEEWNKYDQEKKGM